MVRAHGLLPSRSPPRFSMRSPRLPAEGKPCDVITVSEQLQKLGELDNAGGLAYLGTLARDTPTAANVRAYAELVRERSLLRQLITAGHRDRGLGVQHRRPYGARARRQGRAEGLRDRGSRLRQPRRRGHRARHRCRTLIDKIDAAYQNPDCAAGPAHRLHRFRQASPAACARGDLVIVAGRPSMGKTTLAVNMAEYAAVSPKHNPAPSASSAWKCRRTR